MKKIFLLTLSATLLGGSLVACGSATKVSTSPSKMSKVNFAYEAVSSLSLVGDGGANLRSRIKMAKDEAETGGTSTSSSTSSSASSETSSPESASSNPTKDLSDDKAIIESFLPEADLILNDKEKPTSTQKSVSDKEGYENKETIVLASMDGTESSLTLYYNSVASSDWENLDEDDDEENDDERDEDEEENKDEHDEEEKDDDEYEFTVGSMYKGIIIDGDTTYYYESKEVSVTEDDETKKTIAMRMSLDPTSFATSVHSFYELENDDGDMEESFSYKIYENNELMMEFEVDLPHEGRTDFDFEVNDNEYLIKSSSTYNEKDGYFLMVYRDDKEEKLSWVYERTLLEASYTYSEII